MMDDRVADNVRLRQWLRRTIAEREIAIEALRIIATDPANAQARAEGALARIMSVPMPEASK